MTDSLTTANLMKAAIARMLGYVSDAGDSLHVLCADRVFLRRAPDDAVMPYVVVTKRNGATDPDFSNLREEFDLECLAVAADPQVAELSADLAENALLTWRESSAQMGLVYGRTSTRETDPADTDPTNRDRYEVLVAVTVGAWPRSLTDAIT